MWIPDWFYYAILAAPYVAAGLVLVAAYGVYRLVKRLVRK